MQSEHRKIGKQSVIEIEICCKTASKETLKFLTLTLLQKFERVIEMKDIHPCVENFNIKIQDIINKFMSEKIKTPGQKKNWVDIQIKNFTNKKHLSYEKYKTASLLEN